MCIQATTIFTPVFYVCIKWWNFEKGLHSYKKRLLLLQTECTTEGLCINRHTHYSPYHPPLRPTLAQLHFLSFPALLRSWEAVHGRPHHLGHPCLLAPDWVRPVGGISKKTRGLEERDYGISFLLSPCSAISVSYVVFLAVAILCHDYSIPWDLVILILPLVPSSLEM